MTSSPRLVWEFGQRAGLFDLPSRSICTLHGDEFGRDLSRKALAKAADHKLRGLQQSAGLFNADTGWMLRINKNGRSKMGDNPQLTPVESQAIAGIERLVEQAVLAETHGDVEHRNPQVLAIHRLYAALEIRGALYRIKWTVKSFAAVVGQGETLHALQAVEIENAPLGTLPAHEAPTVPKPQAQPTTGRAISVRDLLIGAQRHDGSPFG
jgi:hypothetical protein